MPKKKPLPNSAGMYDDTAKEIRDKYPAAWRVFPQFRDPILNRKVVTELAKCHHIPADFDLETLLDDALKRYFYVYARDRVVKPYSAQQKNTFGQ